MRNDGRQVGTVVAIDRDAGENGRVSYTILSGNLNDTFDINRSTGALFTTREVSGEVEPPSSYTPPVPPASSSRTHQERRKLALFQVAKRLRITGDMVSLATATCMNKNSHTFSY